MTSPSMTYRVGHLGTPHTWKPEYTRAVKWNKHNLQRLKDLGFNTIQLNLAWGSRPGGEALTLEDVVELPPDLQERYPQPALMKGDQSPETRAKRKQELLKRITLCRAAGMRTIFHFGAPYNAHARYGDAPPNCISDPKVTEKYVLMLRLFAHDFPGVDDILIYTYDQDAWLCSEFGPCPRCMGVPLHKRVTPFIERLAQTWLEYSPKGRLWWEPWELSAGQVFQCVERINNKGFGLALHSNIAEVMATIAVDRWLKNTCELASRRGIPVIVEHFLGAASEEVESFLHLSHPLVTLRALKTIAALPGMAGIKEYYGLIPDKEDPNLRMTSLFFSDPQIAEGEALQALAKPYGEAAEEMMAFWKETSAGMELFPWDGYWGLRHIGTRTPQHGLSAAGMKSYMGHTPSWASTRLAIYMKADNNIPDPWMLEDIQLRCQAAADRWRNALEIGHKAIPLVPQEMKESFERNLADLAGIRRRTLSYVFHHRETNLASMLRWQKEERQPLSEKLIQELQELLKRDAENCREEDLPTGEIEKAIEVLGHNRGQFLQDYFC